MYLFVLNPATLPWQRNFDVREIYAYNVPVPFLVSLLTTYYGHQHMNNKP